MKDEDRKEELETGILLIEPGIDPEDAEGIAAPCCPGSAVTPIR
jgi:hypothetical protein